MKVFFDIITNHTADVIGYTDGARTAYVSKDQRPYRTAAGTPFDDRDYAGTSTFPRLDPSSSFPYTPVLEPAETDLKVPAWLNDVRRYHNRGNTTFTGEDSQYGDFFGLDDLFTEQPRVVNGMQRIYKTWVRDFGIDGFRIDTMKHVNDEFWQSFGPGLLRYAHRHGKPRFFMFGEVAFDGYDAGAKAFTSHYTTHDKMQSVLDFPFKDAARDFASRGLGNAPLARFFVNDDWYTDANSNAYQLPTFLGNHDFGRVGLFLATDNPGASDSELLARDRLAHQLMYLSRGNPVVYYGDEQGFAGSGGDQLARQSMFASQVAEYLDDDLIGTDSTHAVDNFDTSHPLYRAIRRLARLTDRHPALRNGAQQVRYASADAGIFAFSRIDRGRRHEYVVALNNSESAQSAHVRTFIRNGNFRLRYGAGVERLTTDAHRRLEVTVPGLSAVVYESTGRIPRSHRAPHLRLAKPAPSAESRGRMRVKALVRGSSFYEVTFRVEGGHRSMALHRHRRLRAVPGLPGHQQPAHRDQAALPGGRARQRRAHPDERQALRKGPGTDDRDHLAHGRRDREQRRPGHGARHRRPGAGVGVGSLPAQRGRRRLGDHPHRPLVAGLHRNRRRLRPSARDTHPLSRRSARTRHAESHQCAGQGHDRSAATCAGPRDPRGGPAERGRLRGRLGSGLRGRPGSPSTPPTVSGTAPSPSLPETSNGRSRSTTRLPRTMGRVGLSAVPTWS